MPDHLNNKEFFELLKTYQVHDHSTTCLNAMETKTETETNKTYTNPNFTP